MKSFSEEPRNSSHWLSHYGQKNFYRISTKKITMQIQSQYNTISIRYVVFFNDITNQIILQNSEKIH